jgi:hypothetical protein
MVGLLGTYEPLFNFLWVDTYFHAWFFTIDYDNEEWTLDVYVEA